MRRDLAQAAGAYKRRPGHGKRWAAHARIQGGRTGMCSAIDAIVAASIATMAMT